MPKHRAERQLTDQNWDQEEEPEEAGEFKQASDAVMKQRKIKKAIRKTGTGKESSGFGGAFSGFGGLGSLGGNTGSLFTKPTTNGSSVTSTGQVSATVKLFETPKADSQAAEQSSSVEMNGVKKKGDNSGYLKQLKALNEGVLAWIKQHVDKNPYCLLTPIFSDYEQHLLQIEKKYPKRAKDDNTTNKAEAETEKSSKPETSKSPERPAGSGFTFASSAAPALTSTTSPVKPSPFSAFNFGAVSASGFKPGFSFGTGNTTVTADNHTAQGEEEEYVPPKSEVKVVEEEDAVYTKRCKLFYQKDGAWADKGVGNLHLKQVEGKSQMVIRADTNLGTVLLNILLTSSLPVQRQGKNNVSLMCIPNPPLDPKKEDDKTAVPMLIRVKTGAEADELLAKINELKE